MSSIKATAYKKERRSKVESVLHYAFLSLILLFSGGCMLLFFSQSLLARRETHTMAYRVAVVYYDCDWERLGHKGS